MSVRISRRRLLAGAAAASFVARPALALAAQRFQPEVGAWRTFELTTAVEVADVQGACRVWLPVPAVDAAWQQPVTDRWSGNASAARLTADVNGSARMLYAEFDAGVARPAIALTSTVRTRGRAVDWQRGDVAAEDPAALRAALQPSELLPLDGIVRQTAQDATRGARTDVDKARGVYDWIVAHAHRDQKVRGCGAGDIKALLETGNLGGKCADLNALFVGLCRAAGVPARDVYGIRLAPAAFDYKQLGAASAQLSGAQHCRAEAYLPGHGWVAMDPADVLKVMRAETGDWIKDASHPVVAPVKAALFGAWEGNWMAFNRSHDVKLPGSSGAGTLPFLMYPNGENASGRFDELSADSFRYAISARELPA